METLINEIKIKNPNREVISLTVKDSANDESHDFVLVIPNKAELTVYLKDVIGVDDYLRSSMAQERLVLQCLKYPETKEANELFNKRAGYISYLAGKLQSFAGVSLEGEAKKV